MLLDDHIIKSQAMTASPFAKPFMERLVPWERKLVRFQVRERAKRAPLKLLISSPIPLSTGHPGTMAQVPRQVALP